MSFKKLKWYVSASILTAMFIVSINSCSSKNSTQESSLNYNGEIKSETNNKTAPSNKDITGFSIEGALTVAISEDSVDVVVPRLQDIRSLTPVITITGSSVTPASGVLQNFSSPVSYVVTAEDGTTKNYIVKVSKESIVSMVSVPVPAGGITFPIGIDDSGTATIDKPFLIGITEVPYSLWYLVRLWALSHGYSFNNAGSESYGSIPGAEPNYDQNYPVVIVTLRDVVVWCNALTEYINETEGTNYTLVYSYNGSYIKNSNGYCDLAVQDDQATGFRLPRSIEWEFAARWNGDDPTNTVPGYSNPFFLKGDSASGTSSNYSNVEETGSVAWYYSNSEGTVHPIKGKRPNKLGLYDMSGNVWEWAFDLHPTSAPGCRILRGGSWGNQINSLRLGNMSFMYTGGGEGYTGFRVYRTAR